MAVGNRAGLQCACTATAWCSNGAERRASFTAADDHDYDDHDDHDNHDNTESRHGGASSIQQPKTTRRRGEMTGLRATKRMTQAGLWGMYTGISIGGLLICAVCGYFYLRAALS